MTQSPSDKCWYIDFGCTNHMTCNSKWFSEQNLMKQEEYVAAIGNNTLHLITHVSNVPLKLDSGE